LIVIFFWFKKIEEKTKISDELINWLKTTTASVDQKLSQQMEIFNSRLDRATLVIAQVQKNIGEFSEIGRSMKQLQQLLSSPKLRGNLGEQVLKDLLAQYFPKTSYLLQYQFRNGDRVDAVIKTSQGLIPIDAKFPMENFQKMIEQENEELKKKLKKQFFIDVKKHIETISKKYIKIDEGTVDYSLMYIPSEAVYYEIINNQEIFDFAGEKKVLPVSPISFYAYLKAVLMSFEGEKIQSQTKEILNVLRILKKDYQKMDEELSVLNRHLTNAYNQINNVLRSFFQIGQRLTHINLLPEKRNTQIKEDSL
ncbi:MAG: DNA recombination protein RmuC, partial [Microgenomates group bacterium]